MSVNRNVTVPAGRRRIDGDVEPIRVDLLGSPKGGLAIPLRLRFSLVVLLGGAALLAAAFATDRGRAAPASSVREGGTLKITLSNSDVQSLDPALDFEAYGGMLQVATGAKLLSYVDAPARSGARLYPEVAESLPTISKNGKTYTFTVRRGFRFNTGKPVTARSFERAFYRGADSTMASPAINFLGDVVGALAYNQKKAKRIAGVTVRGRTLTVRLTRVAPDFMNRVALTFFNAVPENLPIVKAGVKLPPSAGPFFFVKRVVGRSIVLKRNPYYGGKRPHHLDEIDVFVRTNPQQVQLQIEKGERDYELTGVPATAAAALGRKYGVNRVGGQFHVNALVETDYIALNTKHGPFADANLRKAANYVIDRAALVRQLGAYAGRPTDQVLPPNMPGFRDVKLYPLDGPNLAKAKQLAGNTSGKVVLLAPEDPAIRNQAVIIAQNMKQIGLDVDPQIVPFDVLIGKTSKPSGDYDMVLIGWLQDFPDPSDFLNVLLSGKSIAPSNNNNLAQFDDPTFTARLEAAAKLVGRPRLAAYAKLDADIMRNGAPWIPLANRANREFVSKRVGCYIAQGAYGLMDLAAACLK
jgi:peptide/nickel transport system substrate-binding protein